MGKWQFLKSYLTKELCREGCHLYSSEKEKSCAVTPDITVHKVNS